MKEDKWITVIDLWLSLKKRMLNGYYKYPITGIITDRRKNIEVVINKIESMGKNIILHQNGKGSIEINSKNIFVLKYGSDKNEKAVFMSL